MRSIIAEAMRIIMLLTIAALLVFTMYNLVRADVVISGNVSIAGEVTATNQYIWNGCHTADIVIEGGTLGGIFAAIAAKLEGVDSVIVVNRDTHLGGMTTGGLSAMDIGAGDLESHGGLFREFCRRVADYYYDTYGEASLQYSQCYDGTHVEPSIATYILQEMMNDYGVKVYSDYQLYNALTTSGEKTHINCGIWLNRNRPGYAMKITADWFIDASYEQDLGAASGVSYSVGREAISDYNEFLAGEGGQYFGRGRRDGITGAGDNKIMAYNYRLIMVNDGTGTPMPEPDEYDPSDWETWTEQINDSGADSLSDVFIVVPIPNGKYDVNQSLGDPMGTDFPGANYTYPTDSWADREDTIEAHKQHIYQAFKHLKDNDDIPSEIRTEILNWGLAANEYTDNSNFPTQLYVREGRRMSESAGAYFMTEKDVRNAEHILKDDAVFLGTYMIDSHLIVPWDYPATNYPDGLIIYAQKNPVYQVPFRALYATTHDNFMTAFGFASTHVAFASLRMEPQFAHAGQTAGAAAAIAISNSLDDVADIEYDDIRDAITSAEQYEMQIYPVYPFELSDWTPDVDQQITLTAHYEDGDTSWDFDSDGIIDAENESIVQLQFPANRKYRITARNSNEFISHSFVITVGDSTTAIPENIYDNNDDYIQGNGTADNPNFERHWGFVGWRYWVDNNNNKGAVYYEYPVTVPADGYYNIALSHVFDSSTMTSSYADNVPVEYTDNDGATNSATWNQTLVSYDDRKFLFTNVAQSVGMNQGETYYVRVKTTGTTVRVAADACKIVPAGVWNESAGVYTWSE